MYAVCISIASYLAFIFGLSATLCHSSWEWSQGALGVYDVLSHWYLFSAIVVGLGSWGAYSYLTAAKRSFTTITLGALMLLVVPGAILLIFHMSRLYGPCYPP